MQEPLADRRILVTRPADEAETLCALLQRLGARPVLFPAITIELIEDAAVVDQCRRALHADFRVYVSPSAVRCFFRLLGGHEPHGSGRHSSGRSRAVAVGPGTARALRRHGADEVLVPPERFDSEGVAELPELAHVQGRTVAIICGIGGRRTLGAALTERGATVEHIECYRRVPPPADADGLIGLWSGEGLAAALLTSSEGVRNLWQLLGPAGQALWRDTPTFVPHERVQAAGARLGLRRLFVTGPGDQAMADALVRFFG